jgi:hypothetical protein
MTPDNIAFHCHQVLDPLHLVSYFAPEVEQRLTGLGLNPGSMCYFSGRVAAFGPVGPGVVAATFYNFNPALIAKHIPQAWALASPADIVAARLAGVDAAWRRLLGDEVVTGADVCEAARLAREAAAACSPEGRPVYAAHADVDWPTEPHLILWHAITLLREHRGDGHIAALVGYGLGGLAALITDNATGHSLFGRDEAQSTRGWSGEQWDAEVATLTERGILDATGRLTEAGHRLRAQIEDVTNAAAAAPYRRLGSAKANRLHDIGHALSRTVIAAGVLPGNAGSQAAQAARA